VQGTPQVRPLDPVELMSFTNVVYKKKKSTWSSYDHMMTRARARARAGVIAQARQADSTEPSRSKGLSDVHWGTQ